MSFVYRFFDCENNIIYVGRTEDIIKRLKYQHFTKKGHLPQSCYEECNRVEYAKVKSKNEARLYELFLISKFKPEYNVIFSGGGELTFELPLLSWKKWDVEKSDKVAIADIEKMTKAIESSTNSIISVTEAMEVFEFVDDLGVEHRKRFNAVARVIREDAKIIKSNFEEIIS